MPDWLWGGLALLLVLEGLLPLLPTLAPLQHLQALLLLLCLDLSLCWEARLGSQR